MQGISSLRMYGIQMLVLAGLVRVSYSLFSIVDTAFATQPNKHTTREATTPDMHTWSGFVYQEMLERRH